MSEAVSVIMDWCWVLNAKTDVDTSEETDSWLPSTSTDDIMDGFSSSVISTLE